MKRVSIAPAAWLAGVTFSLAGLIGCGMEGEGTAEPPAPGVSQGKLGEQDPALQMSSMGLAAHRFNQWSRERASQGRPYCNFFDPDCIDPLNANGGGQAETSIAVDATGQHIVVGFNDTRGFALSPVRVSGWYYSEDGGETFVDGRQLPSPGGDFIGTTQYPQVFGDPEVEYLGGCTFMYTSILFRKFNETTGVQTMGFHRSTDCGKTWEGPFEIASATNPSGTFNPAGAPTDAADKEFTSVDPETGRVIMTWTNFTPNSPTGAEIRATYTDNIEDPLPIWSPSVVVATTAGSQGSLPIFQAGTSNAFVAWRTAGTGLNRGNVAVARSSDNGATWSEPLALATPDFFVNDQVLGNDRINHSPSIAAGSGRRANEVYVVYSQNDNKDGADIAFQRSGDGGKTFEAPLFLNSRPGADRSQWFPWITVDRATGRVYVMYYDQGIDDEHDRTESTYTYSDDGGRTWVKPRPLTTRPFHAGHGNDTGQPNLGDYNQAVAQWGDYFAVWAETHPVGFFAGQPTSTSFGVPEPKIVRLSLIDQLPQLSLNLGDLSGQRLGGGEVGPGSWTTIDLPLRNYVTNPLNARAHQGVLAVATTATPGVRVIAGLGVYGTIAPGATRSSRLPIIVELTPEFVPGTKIELTVQAFGVGGFPITLVGELFTKAPHSEVIFAESFDGVAPGSLPTGWARSHAGGLTTVPWTTDNTFCGTTSNAAFHVNAEDGGGRNPTRFERLFSPSITIPADVAYVEVEMDVCYDTEDDPAFNILAYDGFLLRITDLTPGNLVRSVLVDAFADELWTGAVKGYTKHFPRSGSNAYFQDMSAWAGDSGGVKRVRMRLPGMAGGTVQLRFEYTQDAGSTCVDVRPDRTVCGVQFDNLVVRAVRATPPVTPPIP